MYRREDILILRREGFSRTSLRLTAWGRRWGLLTLTARGMMRRANNRLGDIACEFDLGHAVYFTRPGASSGILVDFALLEPLSGRLAGVSPGAWYCSLSAAAEAVVLLWGGYPTESSDAPAVFASLERLLALSGRAEPFWAAVGGILDLLRIAGLSPDFDTCAICGAGVEGKALFSACHEGLLCGECAAVEKEQASSGSYGLRERFVALDAGLVRYLRILSRKGLSGIRGLGRLSRRRATPVVRLLESWFYVTIGREMHSLRLSLPFDERTAG